MERLTEKDPYWLGEEFWISAREPDDAEIDAVYARLKHYEDLQEAGRLLELPCNVGETVYYIIYENCLDGKCIWFDDDGGCRKGGSSSDYCPQKVAQTEFRLGDIDKNIFLTREEAEAALKGGGQE